MGRRGRWKKKFWTHVVQQKKKKMKGNCGSLRGGERKKKIINMKFPKKSSFFLL